MNGSEVLLDGVEPCLELLHPFAQLTGSLIFLLPVVPLCDSDLCTSSLA